MSTPHSPLPAEPPATLETVDARLRHLVLTVDLIAKREQHYDDRLTRVENVERQLQSTAQKLSSAMLRIQVIRYAPLPALVVVAVLSGLAGGAAVEAMHHRSVAAAMSAP